MDALERLLNAVREAMPPMSTMSVPLTTSSFPVADSKAVAIPFFDEAAALLQGLEDFNQEIKAYREKSKASSSAAGPESGRQASAMDVETLNRYQARVFDFQERVRAHGEKMAAAQREVNELRQQLAEAKTAPTQSGEEKRLRELSEQLATAQRQIENLKGELDEANLFKNNFEKKWKDAEVQIREDLDDSVKLMAQHKEEKKQLGQRLKKAEAKVKTLKEDYESKLAQIRKETEEDQNKFVESEKKDNRRLVVELNKEQRKTKALKQQLKIAKTVTAKEVRFRDKLAKELEKEVNQLKQESTEMKAQAENLAKQARIGVAQQQTQHQEEKNRLVKQCKQKVQEVKKQLEEAKAKTVKLTQELQREKKELEQQLNAEKTTCEKRVQKAQSVHDNLKTQIKTLQRKHELKVAQMSEDTETARQNLAASTTKSQKEQTDLKARLKKSHDEALAAEQQAFNEEKGALTQQLEDARTKLAQFEKQKAAKESKQVLQLRKQLKSAEAAREQLVSKMNELKEQHVSEKKEMERVVAEAREKLANDRSRNTKEKANIKQELSQKSKKILEECKSKFEKKMEALQGKLKTANEAVETCTRKKKEAETKCQANLAELKRTLEAQEAEIETKEKLLNDQKTQLDATVKELTKSIRGNDTIVAELKACREKSAQNKTEMEGLREARTQMQRSMTEIKTKFEQKEVECKRFSRELEEKKAKLVLQIKDNEKIQAELKTCIQREKELREAQETLEQEKKECAANLRNCEDMNNQVRTTIKEAQRKSEKERREIEGLGVGLDKLLDEDDDIKNLFENLDIADQEIESKAQTEPADEEVGQAAGSPDGSDPEVQEGPSDDGDEGEDVDSVSSDAGLAAGQAAGPAADSSDSKAQTEPADGSDGSDAKLLVFQKKADRKNVLRRFANRMMARLGPEAQMYEPSLTTANLYSEKARYLCMKKSVEQADRLANNQSTIDLLANTKSEVIMILWEQQKEEKVKSKKQKKGKRKKKGKVKQGILMIVGFDTTEPNTMPFIIDVMCKMRPSGFTRDPIIRTQFETDSKTKLQLLYLVERTIVDAVRSWAKDKNENIQNSSIEVSVSPLTHGNWKYYHDQGYITDGTKDDSLVKFEEGVLKIKKRGTWQTMTNANAYLDKHKKGVYMRRMIPLSVGVDTL